jgi:peptide/nickel transport system permease protein
MLAYLFRKFLLTLSIIIGVMLLTFLLFNFVAKNPARAFAGKDATPAQIEAIKHKMGLDKSRPRQFLDIMTFRFPQSMRYQESVWKLFADKAPVSLAIQGPAFVIGLGFQFVVAIMVAARRNTVLDYAATVLAVLVMSVPTVSTYLGVQWLFGVKLLWFPVAGWAPGFIFAIHFAALPILVSVFGSMGGGVRFYRTVALEEISTDYVRTARAKGVSGANTLLIHVFRNMLIPVVTQTIVAIPFLVMGSLILETMFQIPGFGGLLNDSLHATDSPVVMAIIYLTSITYAVMLFVTDICYTLVDPRVTLR